MGVVEATYAEIKQQELKKNPYSCLSTAAIDVNPHQVEAFTFSLAAMKLGGAVLADEVGLGKTIEAGLVLKYLLNSGSQKILLVMPSNLRKQWQVELDEKFEVESLIVESGNWDEYKSYVKNESAVVIVSYNFASRRKSEFAKVPWSFCVFDEAHRLRNVYKNGSKMASNLYELTKGIPKLMLTATPMQNSLFDLYGLIQFIDKRIFYSKAVFSDRYIKNEQYEDLRHQVNTVLQRTLRKEVSDYIQFPERKEMTVDFELSLPEVELYMKINNYLKKEILLALPNSHRTLIIQSGYSSSALHERIYSSDKMCGLLIYTGAADKEGSLGGLVELGSMEKLIPLLKGALENGLTCTTDPECFMKNPTTDRINGAACHSCTMISETACENGNRLLDRALVVPLPEHEEMGYFKELVNVLCGIQV